MKKILISSALVSTLLLSQSPLADADTVGTQEITTDTVKQSETVIHLSDLDPETKKIYEDAGITESDPIIKTDFVQTPISNDSLTNRNAITTFSGILPDNIVTTMAVSKKKTATTGVVLATTVSTKKYLQALDFRVYDTKNAFSKVFPTYKVRTKNITKTLPISYTKSKRYLSLRVSTQYLTSLGAGTANASAGGMTLGK